MWVFWNGTDQPTQGGLPASARRLDTQQWVMGLATAPVELREACGWYDVAPVDAPAFDENTQRAVPGLAIVAGRPMQVWSVEALPAAELTEKQRNVTRSSMLDQAHAAIADNKAWLAIASPSNLQTLNQVRALSRQVNGVIRVLLSEQGRRDVLDGGV